ncbi:Acetyltransferase (GNAT) family protein [Frankineae bacterium MT45]|nr:Acetyltransferase (GNAT) family protein [Frankineae bacterium MT45]
MEAGAPTEPPNEVVYVEPPRGYATAWVLAAFLIGGLAFDLVVGSGWAHILLWAAAFAIVVGADVLATRAAKTRRSLVVTTQEVRVGLDVIERSSIVGLAEEGTTTYRVLGRMVGEGSPRGFQDVILHLVDDSSIIVATRDPERLIDALRLRTGDEQPIRVVPEGDSDEVDEVIERSGALFTVAGHPLPPRGEAPDADFPELVTIGAGDPLVGVARVRVVDGRAHLSALAVLPAHMRQGIGSALLESACAWAAEQGFRAITLSTYSDVSWNAPFFATRGFIRAGKLSPGLESIRAAEAAAGFDRAGERVVMVRTLAPPVAE